MKKKLDVKTMTVVALLSAISIVLGMTPVGMIPIGPINATTMHIPVIVGAILFGPFVGGLVGFAFGVYSMIRAYITPTLTSFLFMNPIIALVPRILIGVFAGYVYAALKKWNPSTTRKLIIVFWLFVLAYTAYMGVNASKAGESIVSYVIIGIAALTTLALSVAKVKAGDPACVFAASIGSLTNTFLVMGLIYIIYAEQYAIAIGQSPEMALNIVLGVVVGNGIPEMIVATLITLPIVQAVHSRKRG